MSFLKCLNFLKEQQQFKKIAKSEMQRKVPFRPCRYEFIDNPDPKKSDLLTIREFTRYAESLGYSLTFHLRHKR